MLGKIITIVIGIGIILFAATCFKDVPLIGTVFLMPGGNILKAQMVEPFVRDALFVLGGMFAAYGIQLHIRISFSNPLKESTGDVPPRNPANSRRKPWRKPWGLA